MIRLIHLLLTLALLLSACTRINAAKQSELATSLANWKTLKTQNSNHYTYASTFGSFSGFAWRTTFEVKDDVVVKRQYEETKVDDAGKTSTTVIWTEQGDEVGKNEQGAKARTLEEVYAFCKDEVLNQNPFSNTLILELEDNSILKTCYYIPNGCQDDCSSGLNVRDFGFLE